MGRCSRRALTRQIMVTAAAAKYTVSEGEYDYQKIKCKEGRVLYGELSEVILLRIMLMHTVNTDKSCNGVKVYKISSTIENNG
jgi:hypothetical protein